MSRAPGQRPAPRLLAHLLVLAFLLASSGCLGGGRTEHFVAVHNGSGHDLVVRVAVHDVETQERVLEHDFTVARGSSERVEHRFENGKTYGLNATWDTGTVQGSFEVHSGSWYVMVSVRDDGGSVDVLHGD